MATVLDLLKKKLEEKIRYSEIINRDIVQLKRKIAEIEINSMLEIVDTETTIFMYRYNSPGYGMFGTKVNQGEYKYVGKICRCLVNAKLVKIVDSGYSEPIIQIYYNDSTDIRVASRKLCGRLVDIEKYEEVSNRDFEYDTVIYYDTGRI